ncbi:MAG TPA: hypothetical protein HA257_04075 [Candidatus Methanoperedenaceae archaeon]|nr:hypothetical protein [Candidatus Methanoperedenaceae archaeon]
MKKVKCSQCGGEHEVLETVSFTTCPYCGYTFDLKTMQEWTHYFFPAYVNHGSAWTKLRSFILRRYGVPHDFSQTSNITSMMLHYVPLHVFHAEAEATCKGSRGTATYHKVFDIALPAYTGLWFDSHLGSHKFSVRGRVFFKPSVLEKGKYYTPSLTSESAKNTAMNLAGSLIMKEANESCRGASTISRNDTEYIGMVHYPVWEFTYTYSNDTYRGLVDAANSRVMFVEYPLSRTARVFLLNASVALLAVGAIGGLFAGSAAGSGGAGLVLGIIGSAIAAIPLVSNALSMKARGSEELTKKDTIPGGDTALNLMKSFGVPMLGFPPRYGGI